jgi:hypothetical protein
MKSLLTILALLFSLDVFSRSIEYVDGDWVAFGTRDDINDITSIQAANTIAYEAFLLDLKISLDKNKVVLSVFCIGNSIHMMVAGLPIHKLAKGSDEISVTMRFDKYTPVSGTAEPKKFKGTEGLMIEINEKILGYFKKHNKLIIRIRKHEIYFDTYFSLKGSSKILNLACR